MSEKEMNSYRFTSMEEPTDEMLFTLMHEVGEDVRASNAKLKEQFNATLLATLKQVKVL